MLANGAPDKKAVSDHWFSANQFPAPYKSYYHFTEPLTAQGNGQDVIGYYQDEYTHQDLLRTQVRFSRVHGPVFPDYNQYNMATSIVTDENNKKQLDIILTHLIFPQWLEYLQPVFNTFKPELNQLLSLNNYRPSITAVMTGFDLVHPGHVKYIIVGNRPRPNLDPDNPSAGLCLVGEPPKIQYKYKQTRRPWEDIFAHMFEIDNENSDAHDPTLKFLLKNGDVWLTNLVLTTGLSNRDAEPHFNLWIQIMPQVIKAYVGKNPHCKIIALGSVVNTVLRSHGIVNLFSMHHPHFLGGKRINDHIIHNEISHILDKSGLRRHLAQQLTNHESATVATANADADNK